jgi:hypothetical protein
MTDVWVASRSGEVRVPLLTGAQVAKKVKLDVSNRPAEYWPHFDLIEHTLTMSGHLSVGCANPVTAIGVCAANGSAFHDGCCFEIFGGSR